MGNLNELSLIFAFIIFLFGIIGLCLPIYLNMKGKSLVTNNTNFPTKYNGNVRIFRFKIEIQKLIKIFEAFASGIFLAISLVHILPDVISSNFGGTNNGKMILLFIFGCGFLFFLFIEHLPDYFSFCKEDTKSIKKEKKVTFAVIVLSWASLIVHSFFAGVAMGLSASKMSVLVGIFIAIIMHKYFVSFALTIKFLKTTESNLLVIIFMVIFSLATPLGILVGVLVNFSDTAYSILLVFSAGMLFYLGALHNLDHSVFVADCTKWDSFVFVAIGFGVMGLLAFYS